MPTLTPLSPSVSSTEFVPRSGIVAAGADVFQNLLAAGDANPSFQILGSGELQWGAGGASAVDISLKRNSANVLELADQFFVHRASAANLAIQVRLDADGNARFDINADGKHEWGDGTSAVDTNLYRFAASALASDDHILSLRSVVGDSAFSARLSVDGGARFVIRADGKQEWGDGGGTVDTNLYRFAPDHLASDDVLSTIRSAGQTGFATRRTGDAASRWFMSTDGVQNWGDGTGAADVVLSRGAADILLLSTGDALQLGTGTGAGGSFIQFWEQSADPGAPAANAVKLFSKDNGAGKTQLVARFNTGATQVIATEP